MSRVLASLVAVFGVLASPAAGNLVTDSESGRLDCKPVGGGAFACHYRGRFGAGRYTAVLTPSPGVVARAGKDLAFVVRVPEDFRGRLDLSGDWRRAAPDTFIRSPNEGVLLKLPPGAAAAAFAGFRLTPRRFFD